MQLPVYTTAIKELPVPKLNKFVKDMGEAGYTIAIDEWASMKAAAKRDALVAELQSNTAATELRKEFVAFYDAETGNENDWSEWETAELPLEGAPAETAPVETAPVEAAPATAVAAPATAPSFAPQFVEGAFHQMVADVAGMSGEDAEANLDISENNSEFENLRAGILLGQIQATQYYAVLGFDNMRAYLAEKRPHLQYRKAMFLISNAATIKELDISEKELSGVSWAALRHVTGIMTAENYKEWLDAARSKTHAALIQSVKEYKAQQAGALPPPETAETNAPKLSTKTFQMYPDQKASVDAAIDKAKVEGNTDSTGAALDLIAASYTGKPPASSSVASVLPDLSPEGLANAFSKLNADHGMKKALGIVFAAVEQIWPDVDINVALPEQATAAE